jgi:diacylglycerol O-acyltransferase
MSVGHAEMPKELLSQADAAWLRLEDPASPMMITALLVFGAAIPFETLRATFEERLLSQARFRQRAVQPGSDQPYWQEDPGFDLGYHLQRAWLPPPGDEAALQEVVSGLLSTSLDLSRPLWQFHLVEAYGGGCALVGRVHHSLADGPALIQVLCTLAGVEPAGPKRETGQLVETGKLAGVVDALMQGGVDLLANPRSLGHLARLGTDNAAALVRLLVREPDPRTVFKGKLGPAKRAAWSKPVALAEVKTVASLVRGTVNDVMLAAIAGALRRYLQRGSGVVDGLALHAGLSVSGHAPGAESGLGNQVGALLVPLPVGLADPLERLAEVKQRMDELKGSPDASLVAGLLNALGMAPPQVQEVIVERYCSQETAMIANVPGPTERICLAGAPLEMLLFWIPAFGRVGLCLSISSYAGQVRLSVATDQGLVPDPEMILSGFHAEFDALLALARGREPDSFKIMNAMLDKAMQTLDAMLQKGKDPRESDGQNHGSPGTTHFSP